MTEELRNRGFIAEVQDGCPWGHKEDTQNGRNNLIKFVKLGNCEDNNRGEQNDIAVTSLFTDHSNDCYKDEAVAHKLHRFHDALPEQRVKEGLIA